MPGKVDVTTERAFYFLCALKRGMIMIVGSAGLG